MRKAAQQRQWLRKTLWFIDYLLVTLLLSFLRWLPVDRSSRMGRALARRVGPSLLHKQLVQVDNNLAQAFPAWDAAHRHQVALDVLGTGGAVLAEYTHLQQLLTQPERIDIHFEGGQPDWLKQGGPVVFVSAHLSNWELAGLAIARLGLPYASLYSPPANPWLDQMLLKSREALNCQLVDRNKSLRPMMAGLKANRSVALIMDRRTDTGIEIPFFGQPKTSSSFAATLAQKFAVPLVPVWVQRDGDAAYFKVTFCRPLQPAEAAVTEEQKVADLTTQIHQCFEAWIADAPQAWLCTKRLWAKSGKAAKPGKAIAAST